MAEAGMRDGAIIMITDLAGIADGAIMEMITTALAIPSSLITVRGGRASTAKREGLLPRDTQGTIRYEMDNVDRRLIFVDWDNGMDVLVFAEEIEILGQPERLAA